MGNAGVGVINLKGALLALPTFATVGFEKFFGLGRAVRCLVPLGQGRFMHLEVLYGHHGGDSSAERLRLTDQLFDAALCELAVVARGQPCLIVGDFNVEPTKIPCLDKGISAELWVDLVGPRPLGGSLLLLVSTHGTRTLEIGGIFRSFRRHAHRALHELFHFYEEQTWVERTTRETMLDERFSERVPTISLVHLVVHTPLSSNFSTVS